MTQRVTDVLESVVKAHKENWGKHLQSIVGIPLHRMLYEYIAEKAATKLFWGKMRQFVKLRNSSIKI